MFFTDLQKIFWRICLTRLINQIWFLLCFFSTFNPGKSVYLNNSHNSVFQLLSLKYCYFGKYVQNSFHEIECVFNMLNKLKIPHLVKYQFHERMDVAYVFFFLFYFQAYLLFSLKQQMKLPILFMRLLPINSQKLVYILSPVLLLQCSTPPGSSLWSAVSIQTPSLKG